MYRATAVPLGHAASREGEPKRGYQSPPQSSTKPPDSAERCEWLSAAMRRAGRLARRPAPFWLKMHSALPTPRRMGRREVQPAITEVKSDACHKTWGCLYVSETTPAALPPDTLQPFE